MKVNVKQTSKDICNLFETLLYNHGINIPDEDRTGDESEACIYGVTYSELENQVTEILANILNETKRKDLELETDTYDFNKEINGVYYLDRPKFNKYVVEVKETLTRLVVVSDAINYNDAQRQVSKAYHDNDLQLNADNSDVEIEYSDYTDEYKESVGEEDFKRICETREISINRFRPIEFKKEEEPCQE